MSTPGVSNGYRIGVDGYRIGVGIEVKMSQFMLKCDRSVQNWWKSRHLRPPCDPYSRGGGSAFFP